MPSISRRLQGRYNGLSVRGPVVCGLSGRRRRSLLWPLACLAPLILGLSSPAWAEPSTAAKELSGPRLSEGDSTSKEDQPTGTKVANFGSLTFFADRSAFDAAFPGLPIEDFEAGTVAPGDFVGCPSPLDAAGGAPCFGAGDLVTGPIYQDLPGPDLGDLLLIGAGAFGNPSKLLAGNALADRLEIRFVEPVEAVAVDLFNIPGPADAITVGVYGIGDVLLAEFSAPSSPSGETLAFSSPSPVSYLVLRSENNEAEGVDNLSFGVVPSLVPTAVTTADSCSTDPGGDGVVEPGEQVDLTLELRSGGIDLTGIQGVLTSSEPSLILLQDTSAWPDLPRGTSAVQENPLSLLILDDLCGLDADLSLSVTTDQGSFQIPVDVKVGADQVAEVPVEIPDGQLAGAPSTLAIATQTTVSNLRVEVEVEHTWVGDLTLILRSPAGTEVILLDRPGVPASTQGCDNNDLLVTFVDGAGVDPETTCNVGSSLPFVTGDVAPFEALAAFDGEATEGTWTLTVRDALIGDAGILQGWSLINDTPIGPPCTTCSLSGDLQMTKQCSGSATSPVCLLQVTHLGVSPALGVQVVDSLPAEVEWRSDDCGAGPPVGNLLTWDVGNLASGANVTCLVEMDVPVIDTAPEEITNSAFVSSSVDDPNLTNNTATDTFTIGGVLSVPTLGSFGALLLALLLIIPALRRLRRQAEEKS